MHQWLQRITGEIRMPDQVTDEIMRIYAENQTMDFSLLADKWQEKTRWQEVFDEFQAAWGSDPQGFKLLTGMLGAGYFSYLSYQESGLPEEVFFRSFAAFTRFVREHQESCGSYGFDRGYWTPRYLALLEFRIGELEFEMNEIAGKKVISVHIPSDANISYENCQTSYREAAVFFDRFFPDYQYENFCCESWLLSPGLKEVLPADSRIIRFQNDYKITRVVPEATDYMKWIFKNPELSLDQVPQDTSLQRKVKNYLKAGGQIGVAEGYLKDR